MNYIIEEVKLDNDHPNWPGETVFKLFNVSKGYMEFGCYTKRSVAAKALLRKSV